MIYLNKKIVLYVLFLLLAVIHFVTTSVARDNIFTAIENLPRPVKQAKSGSLPTKSSSTRKRKRLRTSGRLLGRPNPIKCSRRPKQLVDNNSGHYYFLSEDSNFKVRLLLNIRILMIYNMISYDIKPFVNMRKYIFILEISKEYDTLAKCNIIHIISFLNSS